MKCERCGHPVQGASWYCAHCGSAIKDLNVADSGRRSLPTLLRWSIWLSAVTLVAVGLIALILSQKRGQPVPGSGDVSDRAGLEASTDTGSLADEGGTDISEGSSLTGASQVNGDGAAPVAGAGTPGSGPSSSGRSTETPGSGLSSSGPPGLGTAPSHATLPALAPARERPDAPTWHMGLAQVPPNIDGRLEDWAAPMTLAQPVAISKVVFGAEHWEGAADLSAEALGAWDRNALFLGLRILDDIFSQPAEGRSLYLGDSIELQLDMDLEGDWDDAAYSDDDWQIGISPGDLEDGGRPAEAYIWRPADRSGAVVFPIAARRLDDGYVIEAAIPWRIFGVDPTRLAGIGFALNISDNDLPSPEQLTMVSSSPARLWGDPRSFGTLALDR
jgi:hypothetical protein